MVSGHRIGEQLELSRSLFMPNMTVQAMRDSRYKHPANALAELIDNSIDASARHIEVLVTEEQQVITTRRRWRIKEIAVVDDGCGMDAATLEQALRFGGRGGQGQLHRIGKYGMGLPTASVSQARRVDVWSWQTPGEFSHTYIDVDDVSSGKQNEVNPADERALPNEWRDFISPELLDANSGTIVVWSKIDRIQNRAETVFTQLEKEVGRIYRHFINDGDISIRMASRQQGEMTPHIDENVRPNDPLYLMSDSATSEPWNIDPMFSPLGKVRRYPIEVDGRKETVEVMFSMVRQETLGEQAQAPGAMPHGQHARRNMGVSIVRENREIVLEDAFVRSGGRGDIPQNRWWGCEIRFNQGCDNIFGVDHNKQMVSILTNAAREVMNSDESTDDILLDLGMDDVDMDPVYKIVGDIKNETRNLLAEIKLMFDKRNQARRANSASGLSVSHRQTPIELQAIDLMNQATTDAINEGSESPTPTDIRRKETNPQFLELETQNYLVDELGEDEDEAKQEAKDIIESGIPFLFKNIQLDGYRMFNVRSRGGVLHINLNIDHEFYEFLKTLTDDESGIESSDPHIRHAAVGIRTLLLAWARMEDHIELNDQRQAVQEIAARWGHHAKEVLRRVNQT